MNSFGKKFIVTTFGESHGAAIGAVIDGCPAGVELSVDIINAALKRRIPESAAYTSRREADRAEILSGLYNGRTNGAPVAILIRNADARPADYTEMADVFRPSHADYTNYHKYGILEPGGGRSSGRETAARVAAGAVARQIALSINPNIDVFAHVLSMENVLATSYDRNEIERNAFFCADAKAATRMEALANELRAAGDSVGGVVTLHMENLPIGLGEPVFDKFSAWLYFALAGIGGVKGIYTGHGFALAYVRGSVANDTITPDGFLGNSSGGLLGGITNGEPVVMQLFIKPVPSIAKRQQTVDIHGNAREITISGRHDVCLAPRIVPVAEAMAWITLMNFL